MDDRDVHSGSELKYAGAESGVAVAEVFTLSFEIDATPSGGQLTMGELPSSVLEQILNAAQDGLVVLDTGLGSGEIVFANAAAAALTGESADALLGRGFPLLDYDPSDETDHDSLLDALRERRACSVTVGQVREDGAEFVCRFQVVPIEEPDNEPHYVAVFLRQESPLDAAGSAAASVPRAPPAGPELQSLARDDKLTGVFNRRYFDELLSRDWELAQTSGQAISVFLMAIDHFERYRTTFGRQAADSCLRLVAKAVSGALRRTSDVGARYGDEEFAALASGMTEGQAEHLGDRIATRVRELCIHNPKSKVSKYVTLSVGVVTATPHSGMEVGDIIEAAQNALEQAKEAGRDRVYSAVFE